jgi:hypothetical protein
VPNVDDGSTVACTSLGGTCVPYANPTCPTAQQNPTLCENTILLCCLPVGGQVTAVTPADGGVADAVAPAADTSPIADSSVADAPSAADAPTE